MQRADLLLVEWPERGGAWVPHPSRGFARLRADPDRRNLPDRRRRVTVRIAIDATSDRLSIAADRDGGMPVAEPSGARRTRRAAAHAR
jgi:hypothetical protein